MLTLTTLQGELIALARILRDTGDREGARRLYERGVALDAQVRGPDNPTIIWDLRRIAEGLRELGDLQDAKDVYQWIIEVRDDAAAHREAEPDDEEFFDEDLLNQDALTDDLDSLMQVSWDLGDLRGVRRIGKRILTLVEDTYGPSHQATAIPAANLAAVFRELGDLKAAERLYRRAATTIIENLEALDNPQLLGVLEDIAEKLHQLGNQDAAREIHDRALAAKAAISPASNDVSPDRPPQGSEGQRRMWLHRWVEDGNLMVVQVERWIEEGHSIVSTRTRRRPISEAD